MKEQSPPLPPEPTWTERQLARAAKPEPMQERDYAHMLRVHDEPVSTTDPLTAHLMLRGPVELLQSLSADTVSLKVDAQLVDTRPPAKYLRTVSVGGLPAGVAAEVQPDSVSLTCWP